MGDEQNFKIQRLDELLLSLSEEQITACCNKSCEFIESMMDKSSGEVLLALAHAIGLLSAGHLGKALRQVFPHADEGSTELLKNREQQHVRFVAESIINWVMTTNVQQAEAIQAAAN